MKKSPDSGNLREFFKKCENSIPEARVDNDYGSPLDPLSTHPSPRKKGRNAAHEARKQHSTEAVALEANHLLGEDV